MCKPIAALVLLFTIFSLSNAAAIPVASPTTRQLIPFLTSPQPEDQSGQSDCNLRIKHDWFPPIFKHGSSGAALLSGATSISTSSSIAPTPSQDSGENHSYAYSLTSSATSAATFDASLGAIAPRSTTQALFKPWQAARRSKSDSSLAVHQRDLHKPSPKLAHDIPLYGSIAGAALVGTILGGFAVGEVATYLAADDEALIESTMNLCPGNAEILCTLKDDSQVEFPIWDDARPPHLNTDFYKGPGADIDAAEALVRQKAPWIENPYVQRLGANRGGPGPRPGPDPAMNGDPILEDFARAQGQEVRGPSFRNLFLPGVKRSAPGLPEHESNDHSLVVRDDKDRVEPPFETRKHHWWNWKVFGLAAIGAAAVTPPVVISLTDAHVAMMRKNWAKKTAELGLREPVGWRQQGEGTTTTNWDVGDTAVGDLASDAYPEALDPGRLSWRGMLGPLNRWTYFEPVEPAVIKRQTSRISGKPPSDDPDGFDKSPDALKHPFWEAFGIGVGAVLGLGAIMAFPAFADAIAPEADFLESRFWNFKNLINDNRVGAWADDVADDIGTHGYNDRIFADTALSPWGRLDWSPADLQAVGRAPSTMHAPNLAQIAEDFAASDSSGEWLNAIYDEPGAYQPTESVEEAANIPLPEDVPVQEAAGDAFSEAGPVQEVADGPLPENGGSGIESSDRLDAESDRSWENLPKVRLTENPLPEHNPVQEMVEDLLSEESPVQAPEQAPAQDPVQDPVQPPADNSLPENDASSLDSGRSTTGSGDSWQQEQDMGLRKLGALRNLQHPHWQ